MAHRPDEKLFPHFGEARSAVFAIEKVEYSGHDRTPLIIAANASLTTSLRAHEVN
jgi:hypothetical protein